MNNKQLIFFSKKTDDWKTPEKIYNHFINDLKCYDPCPYKTNIDMFTLDIKNKDLFINPPYSKMKEVIKYVYSYINKNQNNFVYLLIPSTKFDTDAYQFLINKLDCHYYMINKRLNYNDIKQKAPFGSMLVVIHFNMIMNIISTITQEELLKF